MRSPKESSAVIAGIGHTAFSQASGRLDRELAIEAITAAITDAGLTLRDVDGLICYDLDVNDPQMLASEMRLRDLSWYGCLPYGGGQTCSVVQEAAMVVNAGIAGVVVAYRAANLRSGSRYGQGQGGTPLQAQYFDWVNRVGLLTPGQMFAMQAHRYLHERGLTNEDLASAVLSSRKYASTNPLSRFFGNSFSLDDHQAEPWVCEPVLRRADCCVETDAGAAVVVTSAERASASKGAVAIRGAARGLAPDAGVAQNYYRKDITGLPHLQVVLSQLWEQTGLDVHDLDVAIIYDAFSPLIYMGLEELGKVAPSEVAAFIAGGGIDVDGELPVNPNGGQLSEAYLHGFNGLIEAVRQVRGTAANQVKNVEHVLVTAGPIVPSSGLILGRC